MRRKSMRILAFVLIIGLISGLTIGCSNNTNVNKNNSQTQSSVSKEGLYKLTENDVIQMFKPGVYGIYQDKTMKDAVKAVGPDAVQLTEEEKQKIRQMNLKVIVETNHVDDAWKWQLGGLEEVAKDLNIKIDKVWIAPDTSSLAQLEDYQKIERIAQNYDGFFTLPMDAAASSDILKRIMEKTTLVTLCSAPLGIDWNHPNWGGVVDADGYLAGVYSAEAAIKILNGQGALGVVGFVGGREGVFHTVQERYRGWNDVFKEHQDVKIYQEWFDDPSKAGDVVASMLAAHPDIKVLLIDWANPPANQAVTVFQQRGLKPWKDIAMVTIDLDNTIVVPMAQTGPDNNYTAAFVTQTWYNVGRLWGLLFAKHVLYGNEAPKYVVSPPLPITTWNNLKTHYIKAVPETYPIPQEVMALTNQWPLGVEDQWK
jgi:ABC-type sugar transport system substrate-binding protein